MAQGSIQVRVKKNNRVLSGWNSKTFLKVSSEKFPGQLNEIPVDGPYSIKLRLIIQDGKIAKDPIHNLYQAKVAINSELIVKINTKVMLSLFVMKDQ